MTKKPKYLIESSAVPVAMRESTRSHNEYFHDQISDGTIHTSIYIRKEFIHRWVMDYINLANEVDHFGDVAQALSHIENDFRPRVVKGAMHAVATLLREKGTISNTREMSTEIARLAVGMLKKFDILFRSRIPVNTTGCKIGGKELEMDFENIFDVLRSFVTSQATVLDCPVNVFLGKTNSGRARKLLAVHGVAQRTKSGKTLAELLDKGTWITCKECAMIGDAVIALEQPRPYCLVHLDKDFNVLCAAISKDHKEVQSQRAIEREVRKDS